MSTQTVTKKRKSADGDASSAKKVKVAKSAEKPAPVKSALKKKEPAVEKVEIKTKKSKPAIEAHEIKKSKPTTKPAKPAKKTEKKEKTIISDNDNDDDEEESGTLGTLTPDQTASLLAGFSSDEDDNNDASDSEIPTSKLPKAPTTGDIQDRIASATKALKSSANNTSDPEKTPGIVYIGRIPHGFHEPQMRAYFSQFGTITHLKLARNRKTGKSKHFAFVEFASSVVADIVAKTMDKYLLFGHLLQVRRVPAESVGNMDGMWVGEGRRGWNVKPNNKLERGALRRGKTREEWGKKVGREERKREAKKEALKELGYEFEMPAVKGVDAVPVKEKMLEAAAEGTEAAVAGAEDAAAVTGAEAAAPPVGIVQVDEAADGTVVVEEKEKTSKKKRAAEGKPKIREARKVVKKVKT